MIESPLSPSSDFRTRGSARAFGTFISGLLCGGLVFWAGHQFWPASNTTLDAKAPGSSGVNVSSTLPIGPNSALTRNAISNIAEEASKSVVNINTQTELVVGESPFHGFQYFGDRDLPQQPTPFSDGTAPAQPKLRDLGSGSGVIIRADGYILTNNHVVRKADAIKVTLADKRTYKATVVGRDSFTDLALLKIDVKDLPVAKLGDSKTLRPGDFAIAIGSPVGLEQSVTLGIVSALGRTLSGVGNGVSLVQTDAAINPGNSGGPLINIDGQVVGINTAIRGDAQNIGFAIPIDIAKTVVAELLEHKSVVHPYIGIFMKDMDDELAKSLGLAAGAKGVVVARVAPSSPAGQAGLQVGDVIQKVDGVPVNSARELQAIVRNHKTGDDLHFLVARGNSLDAMTVRIGNFPEAEESDRH